MLYNPYRNYDKGMDDAYMGKEPADPHSQQYMEGYERGEELMQEEEPATLSDYNNFIQLQKEK